MMLSLAHVVPWDTWHLVNTPSQSLVWDDLLGGEPDDVLFNAIRASFREYNKCGG